jgi:AcrR family transcriptional regulator
MQHPTVTRRDLNRTKTSEAIHHAAVTLVLRHGLTGATIDAIAESAGVSRRTFFNYFPTKEDAVLATRPPRLPAHELEAFGASADDTFARVVRLMAAAVRSVFDDLPSFAAKRQHLLKLHPELRDRVERHVRDAEALVREALAASDPAAPSLPLLMLAGTVMRYAFTPAADGSIDDSPAAIDRAIDEFRTVL